MSILMFKRYDDESLYDLLRHIDDMFDDPEYKFLPEDEHGFKRGTFTVTIEWNDNEHSK